MTHPPERRLRIHRDRIFRVDPVSWQVESWGVRSWCPIWIWPKDGVQAEPWRPAVTLKTDMFQLIFLK